jgi:hypothetical protein
MRSSKRHLEAFTRACFIVISAGSPAPSARGLAPGRVEVCRRGILRSRLNRSNLYRGDTGGSFAQLAYGKRERKHALKRTEKERSPTVSAQVYEYSENSTVKRGSNLTGERHTRSHTVTSADYIPDKQAQCMTEASRNPVNSNFDARLPVYSRAQSRPRLASGRDSQARSSRFARWCCFSVGREIKPFF